MISTVPVETAVTLPALELVGDPPTFDDEAAERPPMDASVGELAAEYGSVDPVEELPVAGELPIEGAEAEGPPQQDAASLLFPFGVEGGTAAEAGGGEPAATDDDGGHVAPDEDRGY